MNNDIIKALNWRYATKKFDVSKKLTTEEINTILEAARLAPSSFGLQAMKFIVVENPETRKALQAAAYGQTQVVDAGLLVILTTPTKFGAADVTKFVEHTAKVQNVPQENLKNLHDMLVGSVTSRSEADLKIWLSKQVYITLGFIIETAALLGVDACPMEGFDKVKFNEILGLNELGLEAQVMATFGHRASDDASALRKKVRFDLADVVIKK